MRSFTYPASLKSERGGEFTVQFPDLPEAITSGRDREDALIQAADCLEEAIAGRIADGLEIPEPSAIRKKQVGISVPATMAAKAALYLAMRSVRVSNVALGRRLRVNEKEIRRMLDPRHQTKLSTIQEALKVLGKHLVVNMDDAA